MTTLEKAMQANLTAGTAERITVDGVVFSRLPLDEPVMWIPYDDLMQHTRTLEEVTEVAKQAHAMIASTGLTWEEYRNLPPFGPDYNPETSIWRHYGGSLELLREVFMHENKDLAGLWHYDYNDEFVVIIPRNASHLLVANHYVSEEEYKYLKNCGFKHKRNPDNHPGHRYAYFLNVEEYDAGTKTGIITL